MRKQTTKLRFAVKLGGMALITSAAAGQGLAQTGASAIEEVIVSAQRRDESLQDVPISIQAFTENTLAESGVNSVLQLGTVTPSLNMTQQMAAITPYIRGVGSPDASVGQESNVAIYVDGVYQANSNAAIFSFNNIDRVEVLKGPQGTLFGRNATGGLIQVITKDPLQEPGARGTLGYGNYDSVSGKLYATTGVTDNVATDIALIYAEQDDGYGDNLTLGTDINKTDERGARNSWLFSFDSGTELRLAADYAKKSGSTGVHHAVVPGSIAIDGQIIFAGCVTGLGGNPAAPSPGETATCVPLALAGATRAPDDWQDSYAILPAIATSITQGVTARLTHGFQSADFTSISAWRGSSLENDFEQMASALPLILINIDEQRYDTLSQEFQLAGDTDRFSWITGLYLYKDRSGFQKSGINFSGLLISPSPQGIDAVIDTTSYALFGETAWALSGDTKLTLGARWTRDERELSQDFRVGSQIVARYETDESWNEPTWRVVLDHQLAHDTMIYGSYARGFKSGNYNVTADPGSTAVNPEFIDAYEMGVKSQLFNNRLQLNIAAFTYDYSDMQVSRIESGSLVTINAAEAEIKGIEMDFQTNVTAALSVKGGISWVDSEYSRFENAPVFVPSATGLGGNDLALVDLSGKELARSPELTYNLGATYDIASFTLGVNYYYNDGFSWEPSGRVRQDDYQIFNAFVAWRSPGEHWGVKMFGNNLSDEEYASFVTEQEVADNYEPAAPRTYGIEVSFDY